MTRALVINDIHLRDTAPSSATESYQDDLFELIHQSALKEAELGADIVVLAGDVFDFKLPSRTSHKLMLRSIEAFREFKNVWGIPGNHDLTQDRLSTLRAQQPLGVLFESGAVTELNGWHPDLPIHGIPWQQEWHDPESRMAAFRLWRSAGGLEDGMEDVDLTHALVVTHAPLYPLGQENEFDHVPTAGEDGISAAMGNRGFLAYGHIHEDHGIFESNGVTYANHGALSRGSLHEYNRERGIALTLWDSESGFERVDLPYKPAEEVFRLTEIEEQKHAQISLDGFLNEVGTSTLAQSTTESIVAHIQSHNGLTPEIKQRALDVLEKVT
jgi:DNA repair exonuclease SbcCD nuclease subunit